MVKGKGDTKEIKNIKWREKLLDIKDDSKDIWKNGPNISSKTISNFPGWWRIDIENPNPWQRPWQLHYQQQWDNNTF